MYMEMISILQFFWKIVILHFSTLFNEIRLKKDPDVPSCLLLAHLVIKIEIEKFKSLQIKLQCAARNAFYRKERH